MPSAGVPETHAVAPLVIVGASAAGLMAAVFAGRAGVPAVVLETRPKPGAKIRVSGGGRCNLLPSAASPDDFHTSGSRRTLRNILLSWPLEGVRAFFEDDLGIALEVEDSGKIFPRSERPLDVVEALLAECRRVGARILTNHRVNAVRATDAGFTVHTTAEPHTTRRLLLATGGLSLPKTGSDGGGYRLAATLGHALAPTFPVLVPLTTQTADWKSLPGVSTEATIRVHRAGRTIDERTGSFLFTHRGFSGPVVLDVSRSVTEDALAQSSIEVHWGGAGVDWPTLLRAPGPSTVGRLVRASLPRRLADLLMVRADVAPDERVAELPRPKRIALERELGACPLEVDGNEGYRTAEATGGGIRLGDIDAKNLESRSTPGLHFAGEILDVDGRIGGYNFLWAFVSGRRAGEAAARKLREPPANG